MDLYGEAEEARHGPSNGRSVFLFPGSGPNIGTPRPGRLTQSGEGGVQRGEEEGRTGATPMGEQPRCERQGTMAYRGGGATRRCSAAAARRTKLDATRQMGGPFSPERIGPLLVWSFRIWQCAGERGHVRRPRPTTGKPGSLRRPEREGERDGPHRRGARRGGIAARERKRGEGGVAPPPERGKGGGGGSAFSGERAGRRG